MADLPETLSLAVTVPPSSVSAGSTVTAISAIGLGVPGPVGPTGPTGPTGPAGPVSSTGSITSNRLVAYNDGTGNVLKDSGFAAADFQPVDADLTAIAALTTQSFGRSLLETASASALRTAAGLVIGTDVQAQDADLAAIAGLTSAADRLPYFTGVATAALATFTAAGRALIDDADAAAQRTTLGLGTAATVNTGIGAGNAIILDGSSRLPAVDGSQLTNLPGGAATVPVLSKSGAYTVVAGDAGKLIECTATLTLTLTAAATLGAGFMFYARMSANAGVVTIDPNSSETIDGLTTVAGYVGDGVFQVICDGTTFRTSRKKGLVLINKNVVGSAVASVDFEAGFGDVELAAMQFKHTSVAGSADANLCGRVKKGGSYATTSYNGQITAVVNTTQTITSVATSGANVELSHGIYASGGVYTGSGHLEINGLHDATNRALSIIGATFVGFSPDDASATVRSRTFNASHNTAAALQGWRYYMSTGNIAIGTFYHFGVRA